MKFLLLLFCVSAPLGCTHKNCKVEKLTERQSFIDMKAILSLPADK